MKQQLLQVSSESSNIPQRGEKMTFFLCVSIKQTTCRRLVFLPNAVVEAKCLVVVRKSLVSTLVVVAAAATAGLPRVRGRGHAGLAAAATAGRLCPRSKRQGSLRPAALEPSAWVRLR